MARNPERRTALVDAAIEVLARDGARGLTYRAVDVQAGVPTGTTSNYFARRDDLLDQVAERIHVRLRIDPAQVRTTQPRDMITELMQALFQRIVADRTGWLALLELRLEATRRPGLRSALTTTLRDNLQANVDGRREGGLPGDDTMTVLLYYAMTGLILERLTLPDVLEDFDVDELIAGFVARAMP